MRLLFFLVMWPVLVTVALSWRLWNWVINNKQVTDDSEEFESEPEPWPGLPRAVRIVLVIGVLLLLLLSLYVGYRLC